MDSSGFKPLESITFLDLFNIEEVQKLQDAFAQATGVASLITHPNGTPITQPSNFCRLCNDIIRKTKKGLQNCYYSDAQLGRQNPSGPIAQRCLSGGLWDGGAGISVGNKHIANWLIGQVKNDNFDEEKMMAYAREIEADEVEYRAALKEVREMSDDQFIKISDALFLFANQLSQQAYQNLQLKLHQDHLEQLVKEKTEELEAANEELYSINEELYDKNNLIQTQNTKLKATLNHLKKTQTQLLQSEKMASLGILTAGVAHEINNPLNFILSAYYGLETHFEKYNPEQKEAVSKLMEGIKTGVEKAAKIVQGLNQFSRDSQIYDEECDVPKIIDNCLSILYNQYKHNITILKQYSKSNPFVKGNVGQLHQVFINVLTNAIQAINGSGTITLKTKLNKSNLMVSISDTGVGIKKEHLHKITDPFFTTKDPGKGTGLGLSITYNIIKEHKGKITFKSDQGLGTTVTITLPLNP